MSWIAFNWKLPLDRFIVFFRPPLSVALFFSLAALLINSAYAAGPLTVNPGNPRFFMDANGRGVYLAGVQVSRSSLNRDRSIVDFTAYLKFLQQSDQNFVRVRAWQQSAWIDEVSASSRLDAFPYLRSGPGTALDGGRKFDLTRFNQGYFDRLRSRVTEAGEHGIYVSVMLFPGFNSPGEGSDPWSSHPFNPRNNVNGIHGDQTGNGEEFYSLNLPAITSLQEAYVRKVVDTLNDLDNVLYELSGDAPLSSREWQYYMIAYLKSYQSTQPKQHPVGMSHLYLGTIDDLFASPADWILLPGTDPNPPLATGDKVILSDMDPELLKDAMSYPITWKSFTRGLNPIYHESNLQKPAAHESVRDSMGDTHRYSELVDLSSMIPNPELCSTGFCLANAGRQYLVYLPVGGTIRVDLSDATGNFAANWFSPLDGQTMPGGTISAGGPVLFSSPIKGDAVLYLYAMQPQSAQTSALAGGLALVETTASLASTSAADVIILTSVSGDAVPANAAVLSWTDSSNNEEGFRIQRKTGTNGTFAQIAAVAANVTSYTDSGLTAGNTYCYRVNAFNSAGASAYTNEACKTIAATTAFNFSLASGGNKSVTRGQSVSNSITATLSSGSAQSVSFSTSGLPSGATASYSSSASCTPTCSRTLNIATTTSTPTGTFTVTVTASGGGVSKTTTFNLTVSSSTSSTFNFSLASGGNKSVTRGQSVSNSISATLSSGSAQSVSFSTSGLPSGATASYSSSASCTPTCSRTLNIATTTSTPTGTFTVTVTASGGGVSKTTTFNLTVSSSTSSTFNFSLASGGNKSVTRGQSVSNSISATLSSGSAQSVSFSTSGLPSGATASYSSSASCTPTCSRTLNIATTNSTPAGNYTITVTATSSGGVKKTTSFSLSVQYFSVSNSGNKSVTRGQSVSNNITATLLAGSSQTVTFSTAGLPTGATASYSSSNSCTPTCSRTLNIATASSTPVGTYTITVTGTGASVLKRTTSFSLTVK